MTPKQLQRQSRVVWFELPALDLDRAAAFYERILSVNLKRQDFGGHPMAIFPYPESAIGGCLMKAEGIRPSTDGAIVYLNADPSIDAVLEQVEAAGGRVAQPRTALPGDMGHFALIVDTEGNRVGLHSLKP